MLGKKVFHSVGVLVVLLTISCVSYAVLAPLVHYALNELPPWPQPIVNTGTASNATGQLGGWAKQYTVSNTPNNYSANGVSFYDAWANFQYANVNMVTDSAELDNLGALTVTFWVNMRDHPGQYDLLFDTGGRFGTGGTYLQVSAGPTASAFAVDFYVIGAANWIPSAAGTSPGTFDANAKWTFMAVTYGANTMQFFSGSDVPAVPVTQVGSDLTGVDYQGNASHTGVDPVSKLTIGSASGSADWGYTPPAWMDDFRIYDSVLSAGDLETVRLSNIVPEPMTLCLLAAGGGLFLLRRKR